ncbi:hypothetical protein ACK3TF_004740 [Chlorella vulgaris]
MAPKVKIAGVRYKNIETALEAEEAALTVVHVAVNKQLKRLEVRGSSRVVAFRAAAFTEILTPPAAAGLGAQVEEQLLQEMLRQAEQEQEHAHDHPQQQQQQQ